MNWDDKIITDEELQMIISRLLIKELTFIVGSNLMIAKDDNLKIH